MLARIQDEYIALEEHTRRRVYFMEKRTYYNEGNPNNITRAALFIFFMRTCYNGIYSVNHSGKLSVTFGAGGRVKLLEEELIRFNHKLLQDVVILDGDYRQTAEYTGANSLFYFDPPYKPVNEGNSCTSYMPQDFGDEEQINLANFCKGIGETGAKCMLSNSDPRQKNPENTFFDDLYAGFHIQRISIFRSICSIAEKREAVNELLIRNY